MRTRRIGVLVLACTAALTLAGVALAGNGGFAPVEPNSPNADRVTDAYWLIFAFTAAIFVLVNGALVLFTIRYRRRRRARTAEGPQVTGHHRLELIWTVIPVLILAIIGSFIFYKLPGIKGTPSAGAADAAGRIDVRVSGHRFYWQYEYANGVVAVDRMRAPVDTVVALQITAPADDVIHSWWVPALGGKTDAIPGNPNHSWFKAERTGIFRGQCAEFCGIQHAVMRATVEVMPRAEFDAWLADEARRQQAVTSELGSETWAASCAKCHGMQAEGLVGPNIAGNPVLQDRKGLETLVREGRGQMPPVGQTWGDRQMDALFKYVSTEFEQGGGS